MLGMYYLFCTSTLLGNIVPKLEIFVETNKTTIIGWGLDENKFYNNWWREKK